MRELSLHILDIAQNSIKAEAETLRIVVIEDLEQDKLIIKIKDDGTGMDSETVAKVVDPFYTTRTTRKVGLGIPLFKSSAEACDGHFEIKSQLGAGTEITAEFKHSHIDRVPLGDMPETIVTIINACDQMDLIYTHTINHKTFTLNTKEIKKLLDGVPISNIDVIAWLRAYISEGLNELTVLK
ncbi:ATP-binding protein [Fusibacter ferrireducens]|uniref:histidine kinase n=1 Tax=Fusibacter ferrireducens TaxID=2785058 RepID=A0ABR9ZY33_9FIRM|nr:ATP-binding protein [Fusibacter ferrireducens]MBF4695379.1 sensor histidine kinase [Fusibacter ferrireducens]